MLVQRRNRFITNVAALYASAGGGGVTTTWNNADRASNVTLSAGNLTAAGNGGGSGQCRSTTGRTVAGAGKYYYEFTPTFGLTNFTSGCGFATNSLTPIGTGYLSDTSKTGLGVFDNGELAYFGAGYALGSTPTGQVVSLAIDLANMKIWAAIGSGNWNNSGSDSPATNSGGVDISSLVGTTVYACTQIDRNGDSVTANFGASAWTGKGLPSGFTAFGT